MPITRINNITREFLLGIVRLYILYHAAREPIFGLEMIRELAHHGYQLSPGTMCPILAALEKRGYLSAEKQVVEGKVRKYYRTTRAGEEALVLAQEQVRELLREIGVDTVAGQANSDSSHR